MDANASPSVIMETDIGRDPDDVFALLYLLEAGARFRAVTVSPGDRDQIALVRWLLNRLGVSVPVGAARFLPEKRSLSAPHVEMLAADGLTEALADADGPGASVIAAALADDPDCTFFCCGPVQNLGAYLTTLDPAEPFPARVTMQGGFIGYDVHGLPVERLEKFEGKERVATFNLGGSKSGSALLLERAVRPRFIGKNVCHTLFYTPDRHAGLAPGGEPYRLFRRLMDGYFARQDAKAMHDLTAAVGHLHPDLFTFYGGELYREQGEYGTRPADPPRHFVAADVDRERLWEAILRGE
jgi:inosine-uridine nucleoside N-ribohydrolase